jgi:hypothetical protein
VEIQERILAFVTRSNWIIFVTASGLGFLLFPPGFARGIFFGGILVTVNFHLLGRTLKKSLTPPHLASHHLVLAKYYLRFFISGCIIFLLIISDLVNPVGLLIGLSIVVFSIILATIREVTRLIFKQEAA